jgi:phosphate acetyltransferase
MALVENLIEKAKKSPTRVALAECDSEKTLQAARIVLDSGVGYPVLVNDPAVIKATAEKAGVSLEGMEIVDTTDDAAKDALVAEYYPLEPNRDFSEKSYRRKINNPMAYAMMLEAVGKVDCSFQGHTNTTGDVLLTAQTIIGLQAGVTTASIFALVETPGFTGPEGDVIAFTDCGLNAEPTEEELASIAIAAADNVGAIMSWEPRVAFLSFSSVGSGAGASVDRVNAALARVHELRPDLKADGEFQLDTAIDPKVAANKVKRESEVAGKANILVFPDLNAANIGVKLIQRFAHGIAVGHTLSGFKKPVADSSRGATVEEMVGDIAMVVLAAAE